MSHPRREFLMGIPLAGAVSAPAQTAGSRSLEERLLAALESIETFDSHEHIIPEKERLAQPADFFTLASHYAISDAQSAGLPAESMRLISDQKAPLAARWDAFEPFWKHARFTGYSQALRIAVRDIYGVEEISGGTLGRINDAIAARNKPGLYRWVLKERARIRYAVVDDYWNAKPTRLEDEPLLLAHKFDRFVQPWSRGDVEKLEEITGNSITSLDTLKQALAKNFLQSIDVGMVTVKSTLAYDRDLLFREVSEADASRDFERMMRGGETLPQGFRRHVERPFRNLEDHMFHQVVRLADEYRFPFQVHTGLHAGSGNFVTNSNPTMLTNVFSLYPKVKFDLFHISYPYQGELGVLAKLFPNVYADFCWAHIIAPGAAQRTLHEFLETIPVNKIFGFGGDYRFPELSYAHLVIARRNIARVLAEKVQNQFCTESEAFEIGKMLLHDGPAEFFKRRG